MDDKSLLNTALVSLLIGGGSYAGLRGLHDITGANKQPPVDNSELEITLPSSRIPKGGQHNQFDKYAADGAAPDDSILSLLAQNASKYALPVMAGGAGLYAGFRGSSALYDHFENKSIDADKERVKNDYLKALQKANVKIGTLATPNVDSLIDGLLSKTAIFDHLLDAAKHGAQDTGKAAIEGVGNMLHSGGQAVAKSEPVGLVAGLSALLALGSGGATYYLANRMDSNKEEANKKSSIPSEIRLNVQ